MAEYLILAGMSGAGRSTAAATFEDRGWFVIDNLPPALIGKVAELTSQAGAEYERVCLVAGRGGYEGIAELAPEIRRLRATGARVRVDLSGRPRRRAGSPLRGHPAPPPGRGDRRPVGHPAGEGDARGRCATRRTSWSTRAS